MFITNPIMRNFENYFKNEKWIDTLRLERIEGEVMDLEGQIHDRFMTE
jgi:hypothetical protein